MKRKNNEPSTRPSNKKMKTEDDFQDNAQQAIFLQGLIIHIHPANFGSGRLKIFEKQIEKFGGHLVRELPQFSESVSHIIFEESVDAEKLKKLLDPVKFPNAVFLKCTWLSLCIKNKSRESVTDHEIVVKAQTPVEKKPLSSSDGQPVSYKKDSPKVYSTSEVTQCLSIGHFSQHPPVKSYVGFTNFESPADDNSNQCNTKEDKSCPQSQSVEQSSSPNTNFENLSKKTGDQEEQIRGYNSEATVKNEELQSLIKPFPKRLQEKFVCSQPSSSQTKGFNSHITDELEKLATAYKSKNDTWRAVGYQKAISAIRNHPKEITTREEALAIRGVGARLADKVAEIVESGKLRKVAEVCNDEEAKTLQLFMGVWGAGPTTAQGWFIQGFRTLEDLRTKANLTRHQQIGLKYYDDINSRIPRHEVAEIEEYVRNTALSIKNGLIVTVCGSYRRGKASCGDVDILITHPDGQSQDNLFKPILRKLKDTGFLTDDLVTQEDNGNQKKYLGVCKLPGSDRQHRRLDVIVVPYAEFAPAIMYFTGSAHFNRSMRLLATKMGMSLSEHGLRAGVVRQGREKLTEGRLLDTPTEESIFAHLGLEYRSPQERDH